MHRNLTTAGLAALAWIALLAAPAVHAQAPLYSSPVVTTSYYEPPTAPVVSYYAPAPVVSYYVPAPVVAYYAPAPVVPVTSYYATTTTTYVRPRLFRPSYTTTTTYYTPAVLAPAVTTTTYVAPRVALRPRVYVSSYYTPVFVP
jgi:hypothetical protein